MKLKYSQKIFLCSTGTSPNGARGRRPGDKFDFFEHPLFEDHNKRENRSAGA